jgi:hypothetical protein
MIGMYFKKYKCSKYIVCYWQTRKLQLIKQIIIWWTNQFCLVLGTNWNQTGSGSGSFGHFPRILILKPGSGSGSGSGSRECLRQPKQPKIPAVKYKCNTLPLRSQKSLQIVISSFVYKFAPTKHFSVFV